MRNLKKVLSLALATVMLLGMMVMGAGAVTTTKDYADGSTVTYKEAVDVMSAIGVFDGTSGSFNPTGNVTRAQAAKIITYMLLGREVAEKLGTLNAPYKDVPASHWAAGSIAYCTNLGIVGGYGNGNFKPDGNVTGYEFAKMLLTALGYDAEREKMTGKDWSTAVARLALTNALDLGVDSTGSSIVLSNPLTREEACQMAFNTIKAPMVEYSSKTGSITAGDITVNLPGDNASVITDSVHSYATNIGNSNVLEFGERYFQTLRRNSSSADDFDRPAHTWTIGREDIGTYASSYALVYTAEVSKSSMKSNLTGYDYANKSVPVYINGVQTGNVTGSDDIANLTGNGVAVEIYTGSGDKSREIQKVVVINTYLMSIRRISSDNVTLSRINGVGSNSGFVVSAVDKDDAAYSTLAAMKAGDYVLVTPVTTDDENYSVASVAVPTTQSGTLTRIDKKDSDTVGTNDGITTKVTVGGTSYTVAKNQVNNGNDPLAKFDDLSIGSVGTSANTVVYLDTYGYAVAIRDVGNTTNYMYTFRKYQTLTSEGQLVTMVQGVAPDGSIVTVNVGTGVGSTAYLNFSGTNALTKQLVSYSPAPSNEANTYASEYVLKAVGNNLTGKEVNAIKSGDAKLNNSYYASNVKFIYVASDNTISVRDGVQGNASFTGDNLNATVGAYLLDNSTTPMVSAVFIQSNPTDVDTAKIVYLNKFLGWQDQSKGQAIYEAYFEGVKQEIIVKTTDWTKHGFFGFTLDDSTNLYTVNDYAGDNTNAAKLSGSVSSVVDDRLITVGGKELNAASAEVIDLSSSKISTVGDIADKDYVANDIKVDVLYDNSNGRINVSYIYVTSVKASTGTDVTTSGVTDNTANLTVGGTPATITLKSGQTLIADPVSGDPTKVTVSYDEDAGVITITGKATTSDGTTDTSVTVTFTVKAADEKTTQAYTINVSVAASAG